MARLRTSTGYAGRGHLPVLFVDVAIRKKTTKKGPYIKYERKMAHHERPKEDCGHIMYGLVLNHIVVEIKISSSCVL